MEEDEDTYGFGSYSELFSASPASPKRLDLGALSPFYMSERLLTRYQQQQRRDKSDSNKFQHVAAKLDGASIDGGLGALSFAALEGGGIVWQQKAASDSDALERRKQELRDITNRRDKGPEEETKSATAVFVKVQEVQRIEATTVQNKVQGVELTLKDGHRLEMTFMPGPFFKATHRDEFMTLLKKMMKSSKEEVADKVARQLKKTEDLRHVNTLERPGQIDDTKKRPTLKSERGTKREEFRSLVRRYTQLEAMSGEGIAIAKQVQAGTGYHLGPMMKTLPNFTEDANYRKNTVTELSGFVDRMNKEWKEADSHRQLHTKAKHSRNEDDLFEYTDTDTGAKISLRTYEQRYLAYVKAHEVNPILHMCPVPNKETQDGTSSVTTPSIQQAAISKTDEEAQRISSMFLATLGVDISSSCIIDEDFFSLDPAALSNGCARLWKEWSVAFAQARKLRKQSVSNGNATTAVQPPSTSSRKRVRDRRRSLILPDSTIDIQAAARHNTARSTVTESEELSQPQPKRSRVIQSDTAQKPRRKTRRQSIVGKVDLSEITTEGSKKPRTPQNVHKSPQQKQTPSGYTRQASALEITDDDSVLCQLCCTERAVVHLNPCNHTLCISCWGRLTPSSSKDAQGLGDHRICPWDREVVTKR